MAKKRRTRNQKMLAEKKKIHALTEQESSSSSESTSRQNHSIPSYVFQMKDSGKTSRIASTLSAQHDYSHLREDLIKTGILTTSIVVAQLVLYFILR